MRDLGRFTAIAIVGKIVETRSASIPPTTGKQRKGHNFPGFLAEKDLIFRVVLPCFVENNVSENTHNNNNSGVACHKKTRLTDRKRISCAGHVFTAVCVTYWTLDTRIILPAWSSFTPAGLVDNGHIFHTPSN